MKELIKKIFTEIYWWQNNNWGKDELPALTSILMLSGFQLVNIFTILVIVQKITAIDIFGFFTDHLFIPVILQVSVISADYFSVAPIKATVVENAHSRYKAVIYILITFLLFVGSLIIWKL